MIQVYNLPTARPYKVNARYKQRVQGVAQPSIFLYNVVFYDREGMLETGMLGIKYMVQISTSELKEKIGLNDSLVIDGKEYKFINPTLKKNPGITPFWESQVKSVTV